ncbi:hypothetical protein Tco_1409284 [Tanacetum coccineum]
MYGHYDYGAHHNFGGSSSQPNFGGDEDFTNMYSPQFSESFREEQSPIEEVEEIQVPTYTSGASDSDYLRRALTDYQAEFGVPFTLLRCWEALKDSEK